ncbi:MAG: prepilin-type N-terminal cleavage/methylation domain-containing protein [Candidatus Thiodubiliella endoseptemdiera]|uniref:Prepilin-type N-terminal cleavage/methylation domain-containing protein n=1 Tax=Candidatus Thiodubiliella endoseptemdiera TaxID=2738886 RepID=A0A853F3N1_9GAMM|nr:prepilin-type N-terminal cleavage/methylation domain-containing protein [Candidatus Thiodubiliella endoseptemdiera]
MTLTTGNNKGFTLIELLIVLLIVGIMVSVAAISIKKATPSDTQKLFNQMKIQFHLMADFSQLKNVDLRINIDTIGKDGNIYYHTKIQQLNPDNGKWEENKTLFPKRLKWKNNAVSMSVETVFFMPNGFITPALVKFESEDEAYQFNSSKL